MQRDFNRSLNMLAMQLNGATQREIGAKFGLSSSRCAQLIQWTCRILMSPKYLAGDSMPDPGHYEIADRRKHKEFWFRQIEKARQQLGKGEKRG